MIEHLVFVVRGSRSGVPVFWTNKDTAPFWVYHPSNAAHFDEEDRDHVSVPPGSEWVLLDKVFDGVGPLNMREFT